MHGRASSPLVEVVPRKLCGYAVGGCASVALGPQHLLADSSFPACTHQISFRVWISFRISANAPPQLSLAGVLHKSPFHDLDVVVQARLQHFEKSPGSSHPPQTITITTLFGSLFFTQSLTAHAR